ncbi:MAG: hypothetical protein RIA62_09875 [Cyclobacteriaceae bacterium]
MKTTQNIFIQCLIIFLAYLSSCGDKDDNTDPLTLIVGTYDQVSLNDVECPNSADNQSTACNPSTESCATWQFNSDGTFSRTTGSLSQGTKYVLDTENSEIYIYWTAGTDFTIYDYTYDGSSLLITSQTQNDCKVQYVLEEN